MEELIFGLADLTDSVRWSKSWGWSESVAMECRHTIVTSHEKGTTVEQKRMLNPTRLRIPIS